jgi:signal transduction histidine kinase
MAGEGGALSFRTKLLLLFTATTVAVVATIGSLVALSARGSFARVEQERMDALVAQFRAELQRRSDEVTRSATAIAEREPVARMAAELARGAEPATFAREAEPLARSSGVDFLAFTLPDGVIVSSAQWTARFGYRDASLARASELAAAPAFLNYEELPQGGALALTAVRPVRVGNFALYCVAGKALDAGFLKSLVLPRGMRVLLYRNTEGAFTPAGLISATELGGPAENLAPLIDESRHNHREAAATVQWSPDAADAERMRALPLPGAHGEVAAVLLIGNSRREAVALEQRIAAASWLVGIIGVLVGVGASALLALRITRPVEQLAAGARAVATGDLSTTVVVQSSDELGELAESFNRMTRELLDGRERLVQAERVAAWRELARRLAHELKNPLFPLQLTVENLQRARSSAGADFDEIFQESTATLMQELANMKAIVGRFSDFAKMPRPEPQRIDANEIVGRSLQLARATLAQRASAPINVVTELASSLPAISADPELLYRAVQNLVLNAIDAMPNGGTLTLRTALVGDAVRVAVADSGSGLTQEECDRLFTPYYTTKQHGTGLGLAIVQSIVSDHGGKVWVESAPGRGATFTIELPLGAQERATHA